MSIDDLNPAATETAAVSACSLTQTKIRVYFFCRLGAFLQACGVAGMREHGWRLLIMASVSLILVLSQPILVISLRATLSLSEHLNKYGPLSSRFHKWREMVKKRAIFTLLSNLLNVRVQAQTMHS